jgi:transposase-like protein
MTERRRWKAEEKLAIIKEVKENGKVVETCRKYSVDPGMYYKWKESSCVFGLAKPALTEPLSADVRIPHPNFQASE